MAKTKAPGFPNEPARYRTARKRLLKAETDLRRRVENVAKLRRKLPLGGALKEDYVFAEGSADLDDRRTVRETRFSELFGKNRPTLVVYSFMFAPEGKQPCLMCSSFLDGLDGNAQHLADTVNLAVVAKAPIATHRDWARTRGWRNLRLLSSHDNTYNADYKAELPDGSQMPILNVFVKRGRKIHHTWGSEMLYTPSGRGQDPRHLDMVWPLWNVLDLTPGGRGARWYPKASYP